MTYAFDPELAPLVDLLPARDFADPVAARGGIEELLKPLNDQVDTTGVEIEDRTIAGPAGAPDVAVRTYRPTDASGPLPAYLEIHGGGFCVGSIEMQYGTSVAVAGQLGAFVVTPEYRLAPEDPYPAGLEDCYATLQWLHDHADELGVDRDRVVIGGQSAGGGLAAALALLARDRGGPAVCFQFLGIPELDHRLDTTSMRTFTDTPMWHRANAILSWQMYLGDHDGAVSPYASPALAEDLAGLPPAYVTTMEFDPLRDEGILYALRLLEAGVSVELHSFPGTFHGSALVPTAEVSRRGATELMAVLGRALRGTAVT
jgi:acetyl esterase/lipase